MYSTYTARNLFHSVMLPSWHQAHLKAKEKVKVQMSTSKCRQNARLFDDFQPASSNDRFCAANG